MNKPTTVRKAHSFADMTVLKTKCQCGCGSSLYFEVDKDINGDIFVTSENIVREYNSFWERIIVCFNILRGKPVKHYAELIFSKEQCGDLVDALKWAKNKYHLENKD